MRAMAMTAALGAAGLAAWWWIGRQAVARPLAAAPRPATAAAAVIARSDHERIADAALAQIGVTLAYDPAYVRLAYPGGDVPPDRGVCSDVVVRALRSLGIDLQRALHEDMGAAFAAYPTRWGLKRPDRNIDHRRVLNLMTWFERQGWGRAISADAGDYAGGDIVAWDLGGGLTHIGVVVDDDRGGLAIVHNIGSGARREAALFSWRQIGHYRWPGASGAASGP